MSYEIFCYGNGKVMSDLLNGIALIVGGESYKSLIGIGVTLAFGSLILSAAFDLKFGKVAKWYGMIMMIYTGLLYPTTTVIVVDPVLRNQVVAVDNVPIGLAYVLSTLTSIEYGLTEALETALHVPDDRSYNATGMLMASDMVRKASSYKIMNPDFANNIRSYIQQCIQYDILHGRYTVRELFNSGNIWEFSKGTASHSRAFIYNGDIVTCSKGAENLSTDWKNEIATSMTVFGKRMFGSNPEARAQEQFSRYLQASYTHLASISKSASEIMQQNMMVNAFYDGIVTNAAELGAAAAVESYAVARATQHSRSAYKVAGEVAGRLLPYIKNVMQLIIVGSIIVVLPLFFFLSGFARMRHFLEILASLSIWAPLYAILNLQMTSVGRDKIIGLTSQPTMTDKAAITIANLPGVEQIAADQVILAGYLALSIPLIAYGLIKGSMQAFTYLASGVTGVAQSSAGSAAEEATTGNYSLGNVSLENTNAYNTSSFHDDSNVRVSSGATAVQAMDGVWNTVFPNGREKTDHREAMSNMAASINYGSRYETALNKGYNENTSAAQTQTVEYTEAVSGLIGDMYEYSKARGNGTSSTETNSVGHNASHDDAYMRVASMVDNVMEQTGASLKEASDIVASAYVGTKALPINGSLSGSASNGASIDENQSVSTIGTDSETVQTTIHDAIRASHDLNQTSSSDTQNRLAENIKTGVDQSESLRTNLSASLHRAENAQTGLSALKADSANISADGTQHVYEELRKSINPETGRNYENSDISKFRSDPIKFEAAVKQIVENDASAIINKGLEIDKKASDIEGNYKIKSQEIQQKSDQISASHEGRKHELENMGKINPVENSIKSEISAKLKENSSDIADAKNKIIDKDKTMRDGVNDELKKSPAVKAAGAAATRGADAVVNIVKSVTTSNPGFSKSSKGDTTPPKRETVIDK